MSKVLKTVAIIAVAVAIVVFAPAIAGVLASVAGSLGVTIAATAISSALIGMGISLALTAVASMFRKAPNMSQSLADRLNTSVAPTASRKIVFGTTGGGQDVRFFEGDVDLPKSKIDGYVQVIALASHRISAFRDFYTENDLVWSNGSFLKHRSGFAPNDPFRVVLEGKPGNGFSVGSGRYWNSSASFTGCAYYVPFWKLDDKVWESGIPQRLTAIVDGCPLYDPRRDSTRGGSGSHRIDNQDTWGFRDGSVEYGRNPALALLTYLIGWRINGKLVWGMGVPAHRIDFDNFRTYANVCEERVATQGGSTVQRYTNDGIFSTTDSHETIINGITAAMGSCKLTDRGGTYCLVGGYDDTAGPKIDFTADDLVAPANGASPYIWNPAPPSRERFNIVRGRFANPDELYQLTDWGDPIEQPALADNIPRTLTLDLGTVSRAETCQRIAKQFLLREYKCPGKFSATFGPKAFAVEIGSVITLSLPAEGWNKKLFRVEEQAESHDMFFQMVLREEDPAIYAWDREEKALPASIRPQGYDASTTITPSNLALTSASYSGANGVNVSEVHVTWTPEMSGRVNGIQIQSRPQGATAWTEQAALFDPKAGTFTFTSNAPGITVEVQARFRMSSAVYSPWATASVATAAVAISYDDVKDTPSTLSEINPTQGTKLDGIQAGATVGGVIGSNIMNPDGSMFVPSAGGQASDTTPPAMPTGLSLTSTLTDVGTTLLATWTGVSDSDLAGYVLAIKQGTGNYVEFVGGLSTSYERTAMPRNTAFTAKVAAYDKAGNRSAFTSEVTTTTARDTTPPGKFTINGVETTYESAFVTVTAPSDADIDRLQLDLYKNNVLVANQAVRVSPGQKTIVTLPKLLKATTYQVGGFAFDTSGNGSPGVTSVEFTTAGGVAASDFTPGLEAIGTVTSLPSASAYTGPSVVFFDGELYRYSDGGWTKSVDFADVTGKGKPAENATVGAPAGTNVGGTPATTVESRANSPAARINEDTVTIDGGKITAKSISAAQIAAQSITANEVQTGTLTAAQMATGSLTASVVAVGNPDNIIGDSDFRDAKWWNSGIADGRLTVGHTGMKENRRELLIDPGGGIDVHSMFFPVEPGATYRISFGVYTYPEFNGAFRPIIHVPGIIWMSLKGSGVGMDPSDGAAIHNYTTAGTYFSNTFVFTNPGGSDQGRWQFRLGGSWTGKCAFTVKINRVSDTTLIKDGAITTDKITVGTLNGDRITAGTLNANAIAADTVLAGTVKVGSTPLSLTVNQAANSAPVTWKQYQGLYVFDGLRVTKTGPNDWNVNAYSDQNYFGGCTISGKFPNDSTFFGLQQTQHSGTNYGGLIASWHRSSNGNWYIFESGGVAFVGTSHDGLAFNSDTTFSIIYDGVYFRYFADTKLVRTVATSAGMTLYAGVNVAVPGNSVRLLTFTGAQDNSLLYADPAQRINAHTTTIAPGKITIQGSTTLDSWRDQTEIRGGAIKANSVASEKLTIASRGISFIGLDFEWRPSTGYVYWSEGYIYYINDAGADVGEYIPAGNTGGAAPHLWFYWFPGAGRLHFNQANPARAGIITLASWWGGPSLNVTYGGTVVNGNKITTGTIAADKISVGSLSAISANVGTVTAGLVRSTSGNAYFDLDNARIVFNNGSVMKVQGVGFGSANQFIEWFGPVQNNFSNCTEANATYYLKTNGSAYFGGALSAGTLKNSVQTTSLAADANVTTGTFGSNGRQRIVTVSYNMSGNTSITGGCPAPYTPYATIRLYRGTNAGGQLLAEQRIDGSHQCSPGQGQYEPGYYSDNIGGSITYTDNSGGGQTSYFVQIVARNTGVLNAQLLGVTSVEQ